ncbi:hypothetical protein M1B34_17805 [Pseudomonas sp. MAFF 302030]|uniref:Uncharacterized protein n=1 Tax=Pseudomonas morbosilactucae TaxID=2938197 RepID=A0A9X2C7S2_9PSED|nr:hypothetical protein [Pseudomonas morbosilactucae]MCK9799509.1 hypothetical protein [Pseudomonas morbosilactucae]
MKSFIYLDRFKMYSLSSQLMEGVTDYILEETHGSVANETTQKGPVASGRIIAEIIEKASSSFEKKFLHDYAYSVFEDRLVELSKLVKLDASFSRADVLGCLQHSQIARIKGKAKFVDYLEVVKTLRAMNTIRQSLGIVTSNGEREELIQKIANLNSSKKSEIQTLQNELKVISDPKTFSQSSNDNLYQKHLGDVLEFSFGNTLELSMEFSDFKVAADLSRENLRESESLIVKKYSRFTEVEFVLLGVVTQIGELAPSPEPGEITENHTFREAININTAALAAVESSFKQRTSDEIIIDPIAVYVEL